MNKFLAVLLILVAFSLFFISETDFSGTILNDILVLMAFILLVTVLFLTIKKNDLLI